MKTPRDWLRSRTARRIKAHGLVRGVFSFDASDQYVTRTLAVIPVLAPPQPPRRRSPSATGVFFDCE